MAKHLELRGTQELMSKLQSMQKLEAAKRIVRVNVSELNRSMVRKAVFTRGYSTGQTRRSITLNFRDNGLTGAVKPTTEYAVYVEYGTRKMSAQSFVRPAFYEQKTKFLRDLRRLVK